MVAELIVVACHGPDWIGQCRESLQEYIPRADALFIDTSGTVAHGADVAIQGGHPTGAYIWAYEQYAAVDRFLFIQDSMTALADPLPWFREQMPNRGAVAWGRFPMQWDSEEQVRWVQDQYPCVTCDYGIFGPVFYTDRASLDTLARRGLLPKIPTNRIEAQGTERAWAYAFTAAGMHITGPVWDPNAMRDGFGPFRKVFAGRP